MGGWWVVGLGSRFSCLIPEMERFSLGLPQTLKNGNCESVRNLQWQTDIRSNFMTLFFEVRKCNEKYCVR